MKSFEETIFGLSDEDLPTQVFKHNEFECLNLNITCPAGLNSHSHIPVMVWVHGYVVCHVLLDAVSRVN